MAGAIVSMVGEKLASLLEAEFLLLWGAKEEAERLRSTLLLIQKVVHAAERRSITDVAVRDWLTKLADVAYDADDVLDMIQTKYLVRKSMRRWSFCKKVRWFFSLSNPLVLQLRTAHMIKDIKARLDNIAEDRSKYSLVESSASVMRASSWARERETHSFIHQDEVYGRHEDKEKIIDLLINTGHDVEMTVIPVVGIGGIGKSTLARLVFNDSSIKAYFQKFIWAYVSEVFDLKKVIPNIIESATDAECPGSKLEPLQRRLREALSGSKYLLVLDDVWTEKAEDWEKLKQLLRNGMQGSKIIVTTRSKRVASIMGTIPPHQLSGIPYDQCWALFEGRAFAAAAEGVRERLQVIGKEIVRKCVGVPLAVKSLAGLLQSKDEEKDWLDVRDSEIWQLPEDGNGILSALRLSYSHLPSPVKHCFAYCSLFRKGEQFVKDDLINMWIAEGFISSPDCHRQLEDVGQDYVNILLSCSFFQIVASKDQPVRVNMHDLVHALACSVACDRFLHAKPLNDEVSIVPLRCRHLYIYDEMFASTTFQAPKRLRSLHTCTNIDLPRSNSFEKALNNLLPTLTRLRVLELSYAPIMEVPKSIGELRHLRYINLSHTDIETLPECIGNLQNLRTLDLSECQKLKGLPEAISSLQSLVSLDLGRCPQLCELPRGMSNLTNLKHLKMQGCDSLNETPPLIGRLSKLQTLTFFAVGTEPGCGIEELQHLNQLKGELSIIRIENVGEAANAAKANLKGKRELRSVGIIWSHTSGSHENVEDVLEGLQPHPNIQELEIHGYSGAKLPNWIGMTTPKSSLENLVTLSLGCLTSCKSLPSLGILPSLKKLFISKLPMVSRIGKEFHGDAGTFPSLEELRFSFLPNLEEWSIAADVGMQVFPHLTKLAIESCPNLPELPCIGSIKWLHLGGNMQKLVSVRGNLRGGLSSSLEKFTLCSCDERTTKRVLEELQGQTSIENLRICCGEVTSLPDGLVFYYLPFLRELDISSFDNLVSLGGRGDGMHLGSPASLLELTISSCPRLSSLPEWMGNLSSLTSLHIHDCIDLESLPEWFERLKSLKVFCIKGCLKLQKRCEKEKGEDWHKIAHITKHLWH